MKIRTRRAAVPIDVSFPGTFARLPSFVSLEGSPDMGRLAEFLREITPAWLADKARFGEPDEIAQDSVSASDADRVWRESADKHLFGADTPDYTYVADEAAADGEEAAKEEKGDAAGKLQ
jgi:hypothetical protein